MIVIVYLCSTASFTVLLRRKHYRPTPRECVGLLPFFEMLALVDFNRWISDWSRSISQLKFLIVTIHSKDSKDQSWVSRHIYYGRRM